MVENLICYRKNRSRGSGTPCGSVLRCSGVSCRKITCRCLHREERAISCRKNRSRGSGTPCGSIFRCSGVSCRKIACRCLHREEPMGTSLPVGSKPKKGSIFSALYDEPTGSLSTRSPTLIYSSTIAVTSPTATTTPAKKTIYLRTMNVAWPTLRSITARPMRESN